MVREDLVSIIIPTYNEAENITEVLERTIGVLDKISVDYEILVIDDASLDNTADIAGEILGQKGRVIRRISDTKSLSISVLEGIRASKGNILVVMDGDGSHPPELIPHFIKNIHEGYDLIIGSRYVNGGGTKEFPLRRKIISRFACFLGRIVTKVKDNTSGFFCVRKKTLEGVVLTPSGFKIGLEIFVKANVHKFKEVPYIFVNRKKGKSKLKKRVVLEYFCQIPHLLNYKMLKGKKECS